VHLALAGQEAGCPPSTSCSTCRQRSAWATMGTRVDGRLPERADPRPDSLGRSPSQTCASETIQGTHRLLFEQSEALAAIALDFLS